VAIARSIHNPDLTMTGLIALGNFYFAQHKTENATRCAQEALELAEALSAKEFVKELYQFHSKLDSARGNFKGAFTWHKEYAHLNDSLISVRKTEKIQYLQELLDKQEKKNMLALGEKNNHTVADASIGISQKMAMIVTALFLIALAAVVMLLFRLKNKNRKLKALNEEIRIGLSGKNVVTQEMLE
jgi:hypothetical protein